MQPVSASLPASVEDVETRQVFEFERNTAGEIVVSQCQVPQIWTEIRVPEGYHPKTHFRPTLGRSSSARLPIDFGIVPVNRLSFATRTG